MTTPQDPEEEPVSDELSDERPEVRPDAGDDAEAGFSAADGSDDDGLSREDELWQAIVDNYGERPKIEELTVEVPPSPRDLTTVDEPAPDGSDTVDDVAAADTEEHFVPPPPPPLPKPPPARPATACRPYVQDTTAARSLKTRSGSKTGWLRRTRL